MVTVKMSETADAYVRASHCQAVIENVLRSTKKGSISCYMKLLYPTPYSVT